MLNHMRSYEHTDVFENLRMRCNVVLKAAHGQILTAASDIDHILIHLVETVERMSLFICSTGQKSHYTLLLVLDLLLLDMLLFLMFL